VTVQRTVCDPASQLLVVPSWDIWQHSATVHRTVQTTWQLLKEWQCK